MPAGQVLQIGRDSAGNELGLHPRLTGLRDDLQRGAARADSADRLRELEPLAFRGHRHLVDGEPGGDAGPGLARPLPRHDSGAGRSAGRMEHHRRDAARAAGAARRRARPSRIPRRTRFRARTAVPKPSSNATAATRMSSHVPVHRPHLAFVNATAQAAFATLDRVATVGAYAPTRDIPGQRLRARRCARSPARSSRGIGTRVFWVQTGGYDTHADTRTARTRL